ncbi:Aryl-alcohol oxidase-like protein [Mycena indigotica]|uniref:Aryl-alcohol oxidase-like protein n=1 Tax=Mycena indigotica TaxID=2126181 RepID=A0A8H6VSY9_9AGAR|nr:Aryl-alcohol oxidase-like protein [Mycena indigotica]KAF7292847.1 Aryl-alcohol oxidase-like protein [Mycena indigotica]
MGKVHGSLARAGKVKGQTPKVEKQEKKKTPKGRAKKRIIYNRRFVNVTTLPGGKRRMSVLISVSLASSDDTPKTSIVHTELILLKNLHLRLSLLSESPTSFFILVLAFVAISLTTIDYTGTPTRRSKSPLSRGRQDLQSADGGSGSSVGMGRTRRAVGPLMHLPTHAFPSVPFSIQPKPAMICITRLHEPLHQF